MLWTTEGSQPQRHNLKSGRDRKRRWQNADVSL